jgi:hypothetical protein
MNFLVGGRTSNGHPIALPYQEGPSSDRPDESSTGRHSETGRRTEAPPEKESDDEA